MSIARQILELKTLTQTICSISKNDATFTELKILYFVDEYPNCSPQILISKLGIAKSNLALLTKKMIKENLIVSKKGYQDGRSIFYSITSTGKKMLDDYFESLNKIFHEQETQEITNSLSNILEYLNKKV